MIFCIRRVRIFVVAFAVAIAFAIVSVRSFASEGGGHGKGSHPTGVLSDVDSAEGHGSTHNKAGKGVAKAEVKKADADHNSGSSEADDEAALNKASGSKEGGNGRHASASDSKSESIEEHNSDSQGSNGHSEKKANAEKSNGVGGGLLWFAGVFALLMLFVFFFT